MSIEVSVCGLVPTDLRQSVLDRLSNHTHSVYRFHTREVVFDRGPLEGLIDDSNILRLRHVCQMPHVMTSENDVNTLGSKTWTLVSLGRPERERLSPEFVIRPVFSCPILEGNPIEFASALGYRRKFEFFKRGIAFVRGAVIVELFEIYENEAMDTPIAWPHVQLITVTALIPGSRLLTSGSNQSKGVIQQQELRNEGCARVREVQAILKGLVDLSRVEPF